jgi:hypothetical protein
MKTLDRGDLDCSLAWVSLRTLVRNTLRMAVA